MIFLALMILATAGLATCAAYFSIYGLAQIFSGAFWAVVLMGIGLEACKLMGVSYLYRFRKKTSIFLKMYLGTAIFVLMLITSMGIFGFLSASYQKDTMGLRDTEAKIVLIEEELTFSKERLKGINEQIEAVPPSYVTKRMELQEQFNPEKEKIINRIDDLQNERLKLSSNIIETQAKIGPIIYVAEVLEKDADVATFWFVLLIVLVFDPLAIAMTLATNAVITTRQEKNKQRKKSENDYKEIRLMQFKRDRDAVKRNMDRYTDRNDSEYKELGLKLEKINTEIKKLEK